MKKQGRSMFILLIAMLLVVSSFAEVYLFFNITKEQTKESGLARTETINSELENIISEAKAETLRFAVEVQPYLDDKEKLKSIVTAKKDESADKTDGECYNCYIAAPDWYITAGSLPPADSDVQTRSWYNGALDSEGEAYISDPYKDIVSGQYCYTVSVVLTDGKTVVAMDYTMERVQQCLDGIGTSRDKVLLVTQDGIIAGCTGKDKKNIGQDIVNVMPQYAGIFTLVKSDSETVSMSRYNSIIFGICSDFGWSLIVSERNVSLSKSTYVPLIGMALLLLVVFAFIIAMYIRGIKTARRTQEALEFRDKFMKRSLNEIKEPLTRIINTSSTDNVKNSSDYEKEFSDIRAASQALSDKLREISAVSNFIENDARKNNDAATKEIRNSRKYRSLILAALMVVLVMCTYVDVFATSYYGMSRMQKKLDSCEFRLSEWADKQKSILDMFCSIISTDPELLDNYDKTVETLNEITMQYPDISASYMIAPKREYTVYTNNGWQPESDWNVEEREWYVNTLSSDSGWYISAPYTDVQTGNYCITFSKKVYDSQTSEFIGVFGIDFYLDKLKTILGNSYSDDDYAFLVDANGCIVNHPYGSYQMNGDIPVSVFSLPYGKTKANGRQIGIIKDYDGAYRAVIAKKSMPSGFTVYIVSSIWAVYKSIFIYSFLSIFVLIICIVYVYRLMSSLIRFQENANRQLRESADAAIAADMAKSGFLARMSHEIRTPINAVLGMNEMILRETTDNQIKEYSLSIQNAGKTLLSLINSILDFSKIEDGKMEIIPVKYDTATMIHDLVSSISPRAEAKGLELIVRADATLPAELKGDDVRLRQIISNLLTNAVKYTDKGSITFIMKREYQHDDSIDLYVEVTDTGIGIKEEDLGALFESFRRLDEKRNRNIEGTGLGMSIVTSLLEMMDSKLEVKSVYGEGTTFCFRVRQRIASPVMMGDYTGRIAKKFSVDMKIRHIHAPKARVLVVDDNEMNIRVAVSMLRIFGIEADTALSGAKAIELVNERRYHLILMDHMMPGMDGIEVLKKLKEEKLIDEGTAVIALTANAIVGAREMYLEAGFDDYLTKPLESRRLEKKLKHFLPEILISYKKSAPKDPEDNDEAPDSSDSFTLKEINGIREKCPGLDVLTGLSYCMDSREFYLDTLEGFAEADKRDEMEKALSDGDIKKYGVLAHSLKSTSLTIGAVLLSDHAKRQELAAKEGDEAYIKSNHSVVIEEYTAILDGIGKVLKK